MKRVYNRMISLVLLLSLILSTFIPNVTLADETVHKAGITKVNVYIKRWESDYYKLAENGKTNEFENPRVDDTIRIEYEWNIDRELLNQIKIGDIVEFDLPFDYYAFENTNPSDPFKLMEGDLELGTYIIANNKIKLSLNDIGLAKESLDNGVIAAEGKIIKPGFDKKLDVDGNLEMSITIEEKIFESGSDKNKYTQSLFKMGEQKLNSRIIVWDSYLNNDNTTKRFDGKPYTKLEDAYFVDRLPAGLSFKDISISTVLRTATAKGEASNKTLYEMPIGPKNSSENNPLNIKFFDMLIAHSGESLEDFKGRLKSEAYKNPNGDATWGVLDDTVVVYLGNIPNERIYLPISMLGGVLENHIASVLGKNTPEYFATLEHYNSGIENNLMQFKISITTEVDDEIVEQVFNNKSELISSGIGKESESARVHYIKSGASIESVKPKAAKIVKKDDSGRALENIDFKLQKLNDFGKYDDYIGFDGKVERATNGEGVVEFTKLAIGMYRAIELSDDPNYGEPTFEIDGKMTNEFEIKESQSEGILVSVVNPILIDISGKKTWNHGNNPQENQPKEITVQLMQNGKKTHVDGKEYIEIVRGTPEWNYNFGKFPKYDIEGKEYKYTVEETALLDYLTHNGETNNSVKNYDLHNEYIEAVKVKLNAKKVLHGGQLEAGQFNFAIRDTAGNIVATGTNDANGTVEFTEIRIANVGTYNFIIEEIGRNDFGIVYDGNKYGVKLIVSRDSVSGELKVGTPEYFDSGGNRISEVNFQNIYNKRDIEGVKHWEHLTNPKGDQPQEIIVQLLQNGSEKHVDGKTYIKKVTADDGWKYKFEDVINLTITGEPFKYTVVETSLKEYETYNYETDSTIGEFDLKNVYIGPTKYTVTYDSTGGTEVAPQTVNAGGLATKPVDPEKDGYTFNEWTLDGKAYDFDAPVTKDITLVATWTAEYTVTYDGNGNTEGTAPIDSTKYGKGSSVPLLEDEGTLKKTGYVFKGWSLENSNDETTIIKEIPSIEGNIKVYAVWTKNPLPILEYTVTFDSDGGTEVAPQTVNAGDLATEPSDPTKEGYTFAGWTLDGVAYDFDAPVTKNITLMATWTAEYTVTYDGNGNTEGTAPIDSAKYVKGSSVPLLEDEGTLKRTGYVFKGWSLSDGNDETTIIKEIPSIEENIKVYAVWIAKYTVTFDSDGGTEVAPQTLTNGDKATEPSDPTKEGHTFAGWTLDGKAYDFDTPVIEDTTLVAIWMPIATAKYTVTFDSDGGTEVAPQTLTKGDKATKPSDPTKDGYTFAGWALDGEAYDFDAPVTEDITLVATWTAEYTVTFNDDDGSEISSQIVKENDKVKKPSDPTKDGYTFAGWALDGKAYDFDALVTEDITLVATWTKNPTPTDRLTVRYFGNGNTSGVAPNSRQYDKGDTVIVEGKNNLNKTGYTFDGWNDREIGKTYRVGETFAITVNTDLYAIWTKADTIVEEDKNTDYSSIIWDWGHGIEKPEETFLHRAYIKGYPDNTIRPKDGVTRGEIAAIISRLHGNIEELEYSAKTNYSDIKVTDWYAKHISYVRDKGLMEGYGDGTFRPEEKITRAEYATVIARFKKLGEVDTKFADSKGHWADGFIGAINEAGWITGYPDGSFRPNATITREEVVTMTNKMLNRSVDAEGLEKVETNKFTDLTPGTWSYYDLIEASNTHEYVNQSEESKFENWKVVK